jgi:hypothetical protein
VSTRAIGMTISRTVAISYYGDDNKGNGNGGKAPGNSDWNVGFNNKPYETPCEKKCWTTFNKAYDKEREKATSEDRTSCRWSDWQCHVGRWSGWSKGKYGGVIYTDGAQNKEYSASKKFGKKARQHDTLVPSPSWKMMPPSWQMRFLWDDITQDEADKWF